MLAGYSIWQRNFYESVIRNAESYERICEYIRQNPIQWAEKYRVA
jgi:REP element-mobilizing transposase RayT